MEQELRSEEGAEALAGSAKLRRQARGIVMTTNTDCGGGAKAKFALYRETLRTTGW